ncbi:uncharacterized protein B0P05DRAFT_595102 [Gilbertella persicaria]|uniref:uncharacterized protein n=1 Tax=Gilbertella persicaria TaxID=101096 RepID=UPI00221E90CF|nr:uncharacterized protein B0P05DRAFT_595102 [Gilbertella persicaria]KAI8086882.1 hypothetical protein B0P05DRAFT_595102 [Gilbertella persicaria]
MGQNASHGYDENKGSTIFGYIALAQPLSVYMKQDREIMVEDNLLFKSFLYGLEGTNSSMSIDKMEQENRTDSGLFLLSGKKSRLWKDLIYVDQTYYQQKEPSNLLQHCLRKDTLQLGSAITFQDVFTMNLSNMQDVELTKRGLGLVSPNVGLLPMIRKLDLSHNLLQEIPDAIGYLHQLEVLSVSHNHITSIPDTICHLTQLKELNLAHNQISHLTPFVRHLKSLQTLNLSHNHLRRFTCSIKGLQGLASLDLSYNPLTVLPAEITHLPFLRRLRVDGCLFRHSLDQPTELVHNPPSLLETCARQIVRNEHIFLTSFATISKKKKKDPTIALKLKSLLSEPLYDYLCSSKACSHCHGPYFESYVARGRWIERNDIWIPLEYRLCSAHWSDESDRVYAMFSTTLSCSQPDIESVFRLPKPELDIPDHVLTARNRSYFNHTSLARRSSITTPIQQQQEQEHDSMNTSSTSSVKRWRFRVRNRSSFLKNHRLCL